MDLKKKKKHMKMIILCTFKYITQINTRSPVSLCFPNRLDNTTLFL